ncbi:MAG: hypothetical protein RMA76_38250 [Deltaproteobacteria bacterium]
MSHSLDLSLVGCSDIPTIIGLDKYRAPIDLRNRIVHSFSPHAPEWLQVAGDLGNEHEYGTAAVFAKRRLGLDPALLDKPESRAGAVPGRPWLRYSLDFVIVPEPHVIEVKSREWRALQAQGWGEDGTSKVAPNVAAQVQAQLAAIHLDRDFWRNTEIPEVDVADVAVSVNGHELRGYRVPRNLDIGLALLERAEKWYRDHIERGLPVPIDGSRGWRRELERRHPEGKGKLSETPTDRQVELAERHAELNRQIKDLEAKKDQVAHLIEETIGDGVGFKLPGGGSVRWGNLSGRTSYKDMVDDLCRRLDIGPKERKELEEFHRGESYRQLDVRS